MRFLCRDYVLFTKLFRSYLRFIFMRRMVLN